MSKKIFDYECQLVKIQDVLVSQNEEPPIKKAKVIDIDDEIGSILWKIILKWSDKIRLI
jgi:hypothetical protein